jgi:hemerythrin-like domain-containing protein
MTNHPLFDRMRGEHQRIVGRMDALLGQLGADRTPDVPLPNDLLRETQAVGRELQSHLEIEDEMIYDAVAQLLPETAPRLVVLRTEREELRGMLRGLLDRLDTPGDDDRDEQIVVESGDLFELVKIHVRKEEALVFGLAERALRAVPPLPAKGPNV